MTEGEIEALILHLSNNPTAGAMIPETNGCRKIRVAGRGKGKSGGYRAVTFYSGTNIPVFLLAVFSKGERADLARKERNALASLSKSIIAEYRTRIVKARA